MVCANAKGDLLPPMVVYKRQNVYKNWTMGGPIGTEYSCSKSGWFDMNLFEDWFFSILLPHIQVNSDLETKKIVIGDNLASHFSPRVIEAAIENNIYMAPLPAHSTHIMQPLDVSFFGPMKKKWRTILDTWRKQSRRRGTIPKEHFPSLLKTLWSSIELTAEKNIKSGFKTTGIHPYNPNEVLSKLPSELSSCGSERRLDESLLEFLKNTRGYNKSSTTRRRGKKISVRPGQQMLQQTVEQQSCLPENLNDIQASNVIPDASSSGTPKAPNDNNENEPLSSIAEKCKKVRTKKKNIKSSGLVTPSTSKSKQSDYDYATSNHCSVCNCQYSTYTDPRDWICCISCIKWVCGICNQGSKETEYECPECNLCSICKCDFSVYVGKQDWIRCITCNRWVCGACNKGSKNPRYECPACEDED
ncbi:hypothetical protein PPYR_02377 [Photinus pyralis]|uniref:DDE-1 domain-containing protein n=1 Tax=Photinus pyralis TaxID=7054 RepID=A0A5N4B728_PHOPY|nr:uncharacterized protein LOC116159149 [Photinus pyralis]XP_031327940.1 uncharacterized protein LOC116159149 [Photinus pyralis]XP_031327941.1 uncharacterized protein LOC116159149 [Photinus pyralis]KAB0805407.1 hypothetical protein PPYR_02377 [Photinus pyralis]